MSFLDIFKIENDVKYKIQNNILLMSCDYTKSSISLKLLKSVSVDFIIGFSMNIDTVEIKLNDYIVELKKITRLNFTALLDNKIEIIPNKLNTNYEVYLKIKNIKSNELNMSNISFCDEKNKLCLNENLHNNNNSLNNNLWINGIKKVIIITSKLISSISDYFKIIFMRVGIECKIKYELEISDCFSTYCSPEIIFILLLNDSHYSLLPNRFIFYQIEQSNSIFLNSEKFTFRLKYLCEKAIEVWEYTNITRYIYEKYSINKLKWVPLPYIYKDKDKDKDKDIDIDIDIDIKDTFSCKNKYDIFFYGTKNLRRDRILNELKKHFTVKIGYGFYREKKIKYINKSKILLNLHYYDEAGLETCRFNEILNYNKVIISENSPLDTFNNDLYDKIIVLIENINDDLTNINQLIEKIRYYLDDRNYSKKIDNNKMLLKKLEEQINKNIV